MRSLIELGKHLYEAYRRWQSDDGPLMAAATAYYVGLSFFPLLLVIVAGVGLFFQYTHLGKEAEREVLAAVGANVAPSLATNIQDALAQVQDKSTVSGPVGLVTMLLTAMAAFAQFDRAFDRIWNTPARPVRTVWQVIRRVLIDRGVAFLLLLSMMLVILSVFIAGMTLSAVENYGNFLPTAAWMWRLMQVGLTVSLNTFVFTMLFRWLPKVKVSWSHAVRGAFVTAAIWEIGRQVLAAFVLGGKYSSAYGVIGSFIAVLLWCYYAVSVILFGAEYIQCIARHTERK